MAQAITIRYGDQALLIEDATGNFVAPCGITSLNKSTNIATVTSLVPDCDDPDLVTWLEIDEVSRQMVFSGAGVLSQQYLPTWQAWDLAGGYKNVRWYRNLTAPNGGGYLAGQALLTQFEESAQNHQRYQVSFGVTLNGKPTWTPAA